MSRICTKGQTSTMCFAVCRWTRSCDRTSTRGDGRPPPSSSTKDVKELGLPATGCLLVSSSVVLHVLPPPLTSQHGTRSGGASQPGPLRCSSVRGLATLLVARLVPSPFLHFWSVCCSCPVLWPRSRFLFLPFLSSWHHFPLRMCCLAPSCCFWRCSYCVLRILSLSFLLACLAIVFFDVGNRVSRDIITKMKSNW